MILPLVWLICCASAAAPDPLSIAYEDPFTGFRFPQMLGSFRFQRQGVYERVPLGYGVHYVDTAGATASISIYDMNLSDIETGTSDPKVVEEYERIEQGIAAVARQGGYKAVRRVENLTPISKAWLQMNHELIRADGRVSQSYSFIRAQNGKFVKIRITTNSQGTYARLPVFMLGASRAIGLLK